MAGMFGHTWISQYGAKPHGVGGDTWAAALSGINATQIANGLRETLLLASDFPPSAPRFRALCLGIPTFGSIRAEMVGRSGACTPFARLTWSFVDGYRFRMVDADKSDRMLRDAYEMARDHVMRGGDLPEPSVAIEEQPKEPVKPASRETVEAAVRAATEALGDPE